MSAFRDAITVFRLDACGPFHNWLQAGSRSSMLSLAREGLFPIIQHNEIMMWAQPAAHYKRVHVRCHSLLMVDIAMIGFWGGRFEKSFVDVCMFNPYASPHLTGLTPSNSISHLVTWDMKTRRKEHTIKGSERWSMQHLLLSFYQQTAALWKDLPLSIYSA